MAHLLDAAAYAASIAASVTAVTAAVAAPTAAGLGALPRAGPLRALVLGASTKLPFLRPAHITSQRVEECKALAAAVKAQSTSQYIVVTGPKVRLTVGGA
jgi:hypothetical protein